MTDRRSSKCARICAGGVPTFLLAVCAVSVASPGASLRGSVRGQSGETVSNPKVVVVDSATKKQVGKWEADKHTGEYNIPALPPGTYDLVACDSKDYQPDVRTPESHVGNGTSRHATGGQAGFLYQ